MNIPQTSLVDVLWNVWTGAGIRYLPAEGESGDGRCRESDVVAMKPKSSDRRPRARERSGASQPRTNANTFQADRPCQVARRNSLVRERKYAR